MDGWRKFAADLPKPKKLKRERVGKPRSGWLAQVTRKPKTWSQPERFADDNERFQWERVQHRYFKDRRGGIWKASNGEWVWGPPIPPWAVVIETEGAIAGFRKANEAGFWPGMEVVRRFNGIEKPRPGHRRKITMLANRQPEIVRCIVRHPHATIENCWKHCRFYDLEQIHPFLLAEGLA